MMFEIHVLVWNRNKTEEVQLINEIPPPDKWFSNQFLNNLAKRFQRRISFKNRQTRYNDGLFVC
jgi:hypothetical protein